MIFGDRNEICAHHVSQSDTRKIPKAVHYQCVWIVKDIERLRLLSLAADTVTEENDLVFFEVDEEAVSNIEVFRQAKFKMDCINRALEDVPEEYRRGTIDSIAYGARFPDTAHENTWRRWRRVFIESLAQCLNLI